MKYFKIWIRSILRKFGIGLMRYENLKDLESFKSGIGGQSYKQMRVLKEFADFDLHSLFGNLDYSKSQLGQDLFALIYNDFKTNGFFVEFGATDGISLSNTHILEKRFGWNGILVEPSKFYKSQLTQNRNVNLDFRCVYNESNKNILFNETDDKELGTINDFTNSDEHSKKRKHGKKYYVQSVSLLDLLHSHQAPFEIDYLSIDTEGSEFEILNAFDFSRFKFRTISCEHNFSPNREKIHGLLTKNGYLRVHTSLSAFDDWYIHNTLVGIN